MNINPVQQQNRYVSPVTQREEQSATTAEKAGEETVAHDYDQILSAEPKATYEKPKVSHGATIARLKEESERIHGQLIRLVKELLERQGNPAASLEYNEFASLKPDDITIEEAQTLIGSDGVLGAAQTSERIVEFAKAISGGDPEKIPMLRDAIEKGFQEVKGMLGGLPEVSKETHRLVMERLDHWAQEMNG